MGMWFNRLLKFLFFLVVVRPLVLIYIGLNIRHRERLPARGPALLVANHNSHLDTMVLMSLFPNWMLSSIRPVAAADYFLSGPFRSWLSQKVIGIIPLSRKGGGGSAEDKLAPISDALNKGQIVIFFPEGTRGEAERIGRFKKGIGILAGRHPEIPVIPIYLHGLGKALPRGESMLVPFFCDVFVGEPLFANDRSPGEFSEEVRRSIMEMSAAGGAKETEEKVDDLYF